MHVYWASTLHWRLWEASRSAFWRTSSATSPNALDLAQFSAAAYKLHDLKSIALRNLCALPLMPWQYIEIALNRYAIRAQLQMFD